MTALTHKEFEKYNYKRIGTLTEMIYKSNKFTLEDSLDKIQISKIKIVSKKTESVFDKDTIHTNEATLINAIKCKNKLFFSTIANPDIFNKLSDLRKTKEFGGDVGGSGAGAQQTALQESLAALQLSVALNNKNETSAYSYIRTKNTLGELINFSMNSGWLETGEKTANIIIKTLRLKDKYIIHRDSDIFEKITHTAINLLTKDGIKTRKDKWNPADIWLVKDGFKIDFGHNTINDFNNYLITEFENKNIIGVSLKKIGRKANISINNNNEALDPIIFEDVVSSNKSKDSYAIFKAGKIQFRTGVYMTNFSGEVQGKTAKHGKIGFVALYNILTKYSEFNTQDIIKPNFKIDYTSAKDIITDLSNNEIGKDFDILLQKYAKISLSEYIINVYESRKILDILYSKYLSLLVIDIIKNNPDALNDIILYAESKSKWGSIYVKVE